MISPQNVLFHELIGLDVLVVSASNPTYIGVAGRIVDETKHMLAIQTAQRVKKIPKRHSIFRLTLPESRIVEIDGSVIALAPEKRINMHIKRG
ncbi:MAG: ribonuclease P protein subunit [Methanoregulaceae archaeon]|jgi:ribonuclease P protein subunit POP4